MLISKRSRYVHSPIRENEAFAEELVRSGKKIVKMSIGDPAVYFPTPSYIIDAYIKALKSGKTSYSSSQGIRELREAVAERYHRKYGIEADGGDVIVTQGVSEALLFINAALVNENDAALLFRPYYPIYMPSLKLFGGKPLLDSYEEGRNWNVDTEKLESTIRKSRKKPKYMLVTNPNNPTGTVLERKVLKEIVDIANEHDILLISDEIYDELVYNGAKFTSIGQLAKGMPYMLLNGASKDFDATGFRLGFMLIPGHDRTSELVKEKLMEYAQIRLSVNTPAQYAFAEGISNRTEHERSLKQMVKGIEERANFAAKLINESAFMRATRPNGAFYIFPRVNMKELRLKDDREFVNKLLSEKLVQVTRGWGFGTPNHIRLVILPPKDILELAINRINDFCNRHKKEA